ncbi:MAG: hypothetical protein Unbinned7865contig1001_37 [Prokaryotic dsDNA virus sp.]|nr:MAG: hypothetical protein Unbinned7865contig1001_37 [Prokaryotic dsDNA virus sp.]|tara:strand:- start:7196 stop:7462 length:267 start_codon:yes stop_codon:yes gene_type:complete
MSNAPDKIWAVFEPHPNPKDKVPYVYACASQTKGKPYLLSTPAREHADELVEALELLLAIGDFNLDAGCVAVKSANTLLSKIKEASNE